MPGTDIVNWAPSVWDAYLAGRQDGYLEGELVGFRRGYAACDAEISTLQREAARVVHFLAGLDPVDEAKAKRQQHMRDVEAEMERRLDILRSGRRLEAEAS